MSIKTIPYQFDINEEEKREAFSIFKELGVSPDDAVRAFFHQVVMSHSIPFDIESIPNKKTAAVLNQSKQDYESFDNTEDLFSYLDD